ncbi:NDMA-dependent alcohol dehydrogenase [Gordonia terrae]|uniref:alcohol dehydrogenase n=2 Tax=Gordonia terrae TaxID=2055 RepID=A0AAD0K4I2_9ACTN|nr:NDMA-dependent alcohol dehydrogenase [Gordonia terrae]VTR09586.1 Zn-dependent alcohol dehydrogenase [Clostridioides difficile]ANY22197.1 alcohol dehydrogenase [Gordonia terrae]AWO82938.1 NDMA-dependent alcohol dehydrogenase [Gordonia terrae]VTS29529.1 S-(hydroxymethyl)mycothiol dehydrogenase [Gordonia terrae]GAB46336.1 putative zinc-containing alcohol dehydrogenase [Gordonia terrae NBRC 100016]
MKTKAAVLWGPDQPWSVEEIELDEPRHGEVLVRMVAAGLCHSDEHMRDGTNPMAYPLIGGHEGAGVIERVGPGVTSVAVGDPVVLSFIPSCGRCRACARGMSSVCDLGAKIGPGLQVADDTSRHHAQGRDASLMCILGAFAEYTVVNEASCVKVTPDVPLERAALVGCGVTTGWGSSVYVGRTQPGDTAVILGMGGIGCGAVQGAAMAGARHVVVVDPSAFKRDEAFRFGATHAASDIAEAATLLQDLTWGAMADVVVISIDKMHGSALAPAMSLLGKGGTCVQVSVGDPTESAVDLRLIDLTSMRKTITGSWYGNANPRSDIPMLLRLYMDGKLKLDEMVTREYELTDINKGFADMLASEIVRGVIRF